MIRRATTDSRPGLTLLEVLIALAIFLMSLAAITRLVTFAGQRALDARRTDEAGRLARSKFAEVFAGVVPLSSAEDTPFDEDPDYTWSMTADSASMSGLWVVSVTVKRKGDEGAGFTLRQFILDPSIRGSTQDTVTIAGASGASGSSDSSGSQSNSPSSSSSPTTPMAAAAPAAAAKAPAGKSATPAPARASPSPSPSPGRGSMSGPSPSPGKR